MIPTESWPWATNGVHVTPTSVRSQFRPGDLVVAIDGQPLGAWVGGAMTGLADHPEAGPGTVVSFDILRDGAPLRLLVALEPFSTDRLDRAPIALIAFGIGVLGLAVLLLARRPRSTVLRLLFVGAAANAVDISAWTIGVQPTDFRAGHPFLVVFASAAVFNVVFWSTIVHILTIYPVRSPLAVRHPALVPFTYAGPVLALGGLIVIARVAGGSLLDWIDRMASVVGIVASGMLILIVIGTIAGYRRASPSLRRSVLGVAITLVFAALATLGLLTLPIALTGAPLVPRGTVALLAMPVPIAIVVAVGRDRLFQVALLSRSRQKIVDAREDERRRLRRDLHDGMAPTLAGAALKLDFASQSVRSDPEATKAAIDEARQAIRGTIQDIRRLSRELRPPALDTLGLVGAISERADALGSPGGNVPVMIVEAPGALPALPAAVEVAAYRIAVEGMMNVVRHAAATRCVVRVAIVDDELRIEVIDDGVGMSTGESGVGLRSMRERAAEVGGNVTIDDDASRGTRLEARLPVDLSNLGRSLT